MKREGSFDPNEAPRKDRNDDEFVPGPLDDPSEADDSSESIDDPHDEDDEDDDDDDDVDEVVD